MGHSIIALLGGVEIAVGALVMLLDGPKEVAWFFLLIGVVTIAFSLRQIFQRPPSVIKEIPPPSVRIRSDDGRFTTVGSHLISSFVDLGIGEVGITFSEPINSTNLVIRIDSDRHLKFEVGSKSNNFVRLQFFDDDSTPIDLNIFNVVFDDGKMRTRAIQQKSAYEKTRQRVIELNRRSNDAVLVASFYVAMFAFIGIGILYLP